MHREAVLKGNTLQLGTEKYEYLLRNKSGLYNESLVSSNWITDWRTIVDNELLENRLGDGTLMSHEIRISSQISMRRLTEDFLLLLINYEPAAV